MDLTQGSNKTKNTRAKKMMLWFGIGSLIMSFGGLTSAFVASKTRVDWMAEHELPSAFTASLIVIILSSLFVYLSKLSLRKNDKKKSTILFILAVVCATVFVSLQFYGFSQLIDLGYYFTGPTSNVTSSFIFLIALLFANLLFFTLLNNFSEVAISFAKIGYNTFFTLFMFPVFWLLFNLYQISFIGSQDA